MSKPTLGVIGGGFVGGSLAKVFSYYVDTKLYDIDKGRATHTYEETIEQDVLFVCLPTPMRINGTVNTTIVQDALLNLDHSIGKNKPVILKSTVPPTFLRNFSSVIKNFDLLFSPEFLTEKLAEYDLQQSNRHIFGTEDSKERKVVRDLFEIRFPFVPQFWTNYETASLVKYGTNYFFSCKVSLMNELYQVCNAYGVDYESLIGIIMLDHRIGRSHFQVPGPDGKLGYGGSCFPKDINGFIEIAKNGGVNPLMAKAAWKKNLEVRPERDWTNLEGRAISSKDKEVWKVIVYASNYEVSNVGRVRNKKNGRILSDRVISTYPCVSLGRSISKPVHKLVLDTFVGPRKKGQVARHLDGDPKNNRIDNLMWGTPKENQEDRKKHGTYDIRGQKLTASIVSKIRAERDKCRTYADIAKEFGLHKSHVGQICRRVIWK